MSLTTHEYELMCLNVFARIINVPSLSNVENNTLYEPLGIRLRSVITDQQAKVSDHYFQPKLTRWPPTQPSPHGVA